MRVPTLRTSIIAVALVSLTIITTVDSFNTQSSFLTTNERTIRWKKIQAASDDKMFFATDVESPTTTKEQQQQTSAPTTSINGEEQEQKFPKKRRILGSQENLMLPRQYGINPNVKFPQMNHVSSVVLSSTPSEVVLREAINEAIRTHPLLNCHVEGDGEPEKRIDAFKMVRYGDPSPCTFVTGKKKNPGSSGINGDTSVIDDEEYYTSNDILTIVNVNDDDNNNNRETLDKSWIPDFNRDLDDGSWCNPTFGPLWKVELHSLKDGSDGNNLPCALLFSFNHAISDQSSVNMLIDQIIYNMASIEESSANGSSKVGNPSIQQDMPMSVEDTVMGLQHRFADVKTKDFDLSTIQYIIGKGAEGLKGPVILPDPKKDDDYNSKKKSSGVLNALTIISGKAAGGEDETSQDRTSTLQFRKISKETTSALLSKCRENGVTITNALTAAITLTSTDFIDNGNRLKKKKKKKRNYKVLQSLDMRRFGEQLDQRETVACLAGSMDLMHGPFADYSGEQIRTNPSNQDNIDMFWKLAQMGKDQTEYFVTNNGPKNAVRVFDFAMTISDMNNLVHLTAQSKDSQGRAYSAGVSNVGVYEKQRAVRRRGQEEEERKLIQIQHGKYKVDDIYFAVSNARTGCLYQLSAMTVDGEMNCVFHPATPVVSEETNDKFANAFVDLIETIAGTKKESASNPSTTSANTATDDDDGGVLSSVKENAITITAAVVGFAAVFSHAGAWSSFFQSIMQMKENVSDPNDFWAALNFWIFFAVGHPILQPILSLSDVLHGSPGPKIADLVPVTFLVGNLAVIAAVTTSQQIRNAVNIAALSAFLTYVGAGLDGEAGLGDFNLQLDDKYNGQVVRGCPSYEEVRQPSMNDFDITKYQGKWYEQKFHDWTQFKEVYDTTLDIKLTDGGKGWIDDFAVKGPAPDAAKLSWDKSPVANGAHYFLFGKVDEKDPPGILRESGFGVEFPNYIVDVQKDPQTGEYTEAIQFQCLERGGVRVFEGINFMSKKPNMSPEELDAMHARAEKAGMFAYGASPEQMHQVARRPADAPDEDNAWQQMWRNIGVDRLLELLTESIEDGGR